MSKILSFESYCKRIKHLKGFKDLPDKVFKEKARIRYNQKYGRKEEQFEEDLLENEAGAWIGKEEAKEALELFNNYKENRDLTDFSDIEMLKRLVSFEIEIKRIQRDINEKRRNNLKSDKIFVPTYAISAINKLNEQVTALRKSLGLSEDQKSTSSVDSLNQLREKAKLWRIKNRCQFEIRCPICSEMILLKWRVKDKDGNLIYDAYKHPFFKDKILCNEWLWQLYKKGTVTKLDIAKVLFPENWKNIDTVRYIDWLAKIIFKDKENIPTDNATIEESG